MPQKRSIPSSSSACPSAIHFTVKMFLMVLMWRSVFQRWSQLPQQRVSWFPLWHPLDLKRDEVSAYEHVTMCLWLYGEKLSVPLTIEVLSSICHHRGIYFHRWDLICFLRLAEASQSAPSCVGAALCACLSFSGAECCIEWILTELWILQALRTPWVREIFLSEAGVPSLLSEKKKERKETFGKEEFCRNPSHKRQVECLCI